MQTRKYIYRASVLCLVFFLLLSGCNWMVEVEPPVNNISESSVYTSDPTAIAVLTGIYHEMMVYTSSAFNQWLEVSNAHFYLALAADELTLNVLSDATLVAFYRNDQEAYFVSGGTGFWTWMYSQVFKANAAIEGLTDNPLITKGVQQQLMGEALFIRALYHFYLVNMYGDVPLVLTTDYVVNSKLARTPKDEVWTQIISDLKEAKSLLSATYRDGTLLSTTLDRVRPTKWVATALLARAYLYKQEWALAEQEATELLNQSSQFSLSSLSNAFLMARSGNNEAIWQLQPVGYVNNLNTGDGRLFILPATGPFTTSYPVYLYDGLVNSFEEGDLRKTNWCNFVTVGGKDYYYAYKYKIGTINTPTAEHPMMFRLGEQYLIRAEARAQQNKLTEARADLNIIRTRAGLGAATTSNQAELLTAILHERRVELFTEAGHRWFDLKRTEKVNEVMSKVTPEKGGTWKPEWQYFPVSQADLLRGVNLIQTPGYSH